MRNDEDEHIQTIQVKLNVCSSCIFMDQKYLDP